MYENVSLAEYSHNKSLVWVKMKLCKFLYWSSTSKKIETPQRGMQLLTILYKTMQCDYTTTYYHHGNHHAAKESNF